MVAYILTTLGLTIWAVHIPQGVDTSTPQLTYSLQRRQSFYTLAGTTKLVQVVYDLDAIGPDKLAVDTLAEQLRGVLQSFAGPFGGLVVSGCRLGKRTYSYSPTSWGSDQGSHVVSSEFTFHYFRQ